MSTVCIAENFLESARALIDKMGVKDKQLLKSYLQRSLTNYKEEKMQRFLNVSAEQKRLIAHINYVLGYDVTEPNRRREYLFARYVLTDYLIESMKYKLSKDKVMVVVASILGQTHASAYHGKQQYDNEMYLASIDMGNKLFLSIRERINNAIIEFYA